MPPQFLGNPYEVDNEWGDSDIDTRDDEWIPISDNALLTHNRLIQNLDLTESDDDEDDEDDWGISYETDWADSTDYFDENDGINVYVDDDEDDEDDEEYIPDDEDYEADQEIEDHMGNTFVYYDDDTDDDDEDEDEIEYVTYPSNDNESVSNNSESQSTIATTTTMASTVTESNSTNFETETDAD
ncbi:unnamed protein product [Phyllotreta striolata]|uniref:Uncharacterized protein n=1 Tax=Phyllotreta striolata TaxID=444603 RepID=A0A9N9XPN2_PHYSR|nr:unnamed protein product [Phyllotreta striolata]